MTPSSSGSIVNMTVLLGTFPVNVYSICVTATDRAGNEAAEQRGAPNPRPDSSLGPCLELPPLLRVSDRILLSFPCLEVSHGSEQA